jgi:UDP-N-acetyl-2-amino-2-deoxyglucuronate dehydrogenase
MKIFLVGCGRILQKHLDSIKILNDKLKIVGISDLNKKKLLVNSKKLNVKGFSDYKRGIIKTNPDIVSILTPSGNHAENILDILKLKKNIIVEKPMCLKISDGKKIINLAKKNKKRVFVVMQNKFNLPVLKLRDDIDKSKFGNIFHTSVIVRWMRDQKYYNNDAWRGTWKLDGGVISNQASHHLDLLRTIMGNPISVFARSYNHLAKIQCEDTALIIFKFKNNKSAIMEATTAMRPKNIEGSISILGTKGSAKIGGFALNKIEYYNLQKEIKFSNYQTNPKNVYGFGHLKFYQHVIESIKNNKSSEFEAKEAINTVKLINAIYKSIETNKEIYLKDEIASKKLGK